MWLITVSGRGNANDVFRSHLALLDEAVDQSVRLLADPRFVARQPPRHEERVDAGAKPVVVRVVDPDQRAAVGNPASELLPPRRRAGPGLSGARRTCGIVQRGHDVVVARDHPGAERVRPGQVLAGAHSARSSKSRSGSVNGGDGLGNGLAKGQRGWSGMVLRRWTGPVRQCTGGTAEGVRVLARCADAPRGIIRTGPVAGRPHPACGLPDYGSSPSPGTAQARMHRIRRPDASRTSEHAEIKSPVLIRVADGRDRQTPVPESAWR